MPVRLTSYNSVLACAATLGLVSLPSAASETIGVSLQSNTIQLDTSSVKAGMVTFEVTNAADNQMNHEMVVLQTDLAANQLPVKNGRVPESRFRKMGEAEDVAPGKSSRLTLKLPPGHYVLICNKAGHYSQGMRAALTVIR